MQSGKADNVASVLKVFSVLETLAEDRQASLGTIAQKAMTSKSTTHRLLQTMVDLGYVEQDMETERYGLTLKLFSIAARAIDPSQLLTHADRAMATLSRATGESINLGVIDGQEEKVVYVHHIESVYGLSMKSTVGQRNPLSSTSLGKALLAWREAEEIEARIARMPFDPAGPNAIRDAARLRDELARTREQGFAEEIEEAEAGVRCLAAPVFDHLGRPVAAISMAFPLFRFDEARKPDYVARLQAAARETSAALGHRP
ncbi:IclR family transcriptional regulator domain-containing protein [Falsirhodobacter deserti]|uniref:IclR family transcriptional regulator domain-containing protein n=1 Tax=Falsirhodobacter deserti TaxID=1365611 RepID=UPI000FE33E24|nr:IclR family transcriptional regulator C-terminal domain-containing protein [Falsirhodobacter deserti]